MFETAEFPVVLLDAFFKSLFLFLIVLLLIHALRALVWKGGSNVHSEHRIWLFLTLAMLALPIVAIAAPNLRIPIAVLPADQVTVSDVKDSLLQTNDKKSAAADDDREINTPEAISFDSSTIPNSHAVPQKQIDFDNRSADRVEFVASPTPSIAASPNDSSSAKSNFNITATALTCLATIWLVGALIFGFRFLLSLVAVRKIIAQSEPVSLPESCHKGIPGCTNICQNPLVDSPIVIGWFRHRVIMPVCWKTWPRNQLDSVLAHEFAHVRRRDGLASVVSELNTIFNWINPASWFAKAQLSRLAELACDQAAVISTGSRKEYARHLLQIAALNQGGRSQPGIPMASQGEISTRIDRIMDSAKPLVRHASRIFLVALLLVGIPSFLVVAAVQPTRVVTEEKHVGGPDMTGHQWYLTANGKSYLQFRLVVLNPDGTIARGAKVRARSREAMNVTSKRDYFEIQHEIKAGYHPGIRVLASSFDGEMIGHVFNGFNRMTYDAKNGLAVTLAPAKKITVKVVDEQLPVADAKVGLDWTGGFELFANSDQNGEAVFYIPEDVDLHQMSARTEDHRIGGYQFSRKPVRDPHAAYHEIELHDCRSQRIQFLNANDEPIPHLGFELNIADRENYNFIPLFEKGDFTTDENGEAIAEWFPDWDSIHAYADDFSDESWSKTEDEKIEDGVLLVRLEQNNKLKNRVRINGNVNMPDGMNHSFFVKIGSFQHPEENRYDSVIARTDAEGNFTAEVMPGATYCAFINDYEWVSDYWTGIPTVAETGETEDIELNISKGERVKVIATAGPDETPLTNARFSLRQGHRFTWTENGEKQSGSLGRQWWVTTDEEGCASTIANPGELRAYASGSDWRPEIETTVVEGKVTELKFHRRSPGKRTITGQIISPEDSDVIIDGLEVQLLPMDGESRDEANAITTADGRFSAELSAATVGAFVTTPDRRFCGSVISDSPYDGLKILLQSTASFHGQLTDSTGTPLPGKWVRMQPRFDNPNLEDNSPFAHSGKNLEPLETTTDDEGVFTLTGVPYGMKLFLRRESLSNPDNERGISVGTRFLTRGEKRPPEIIRTTAPGTAEANKPSIKSILEDKLTDCRVMGIRMLAILENKDGKSREFVRSTFYNVDENRELLHYLPLWIDASSEKANADRKALFEERGWSTPKEGQLLIVALNGDGNEVDQISIDTSSSEAPESAKAFVSTNIGPVHDAKKLYNDAMALSKQTGRKIWVSIGQTRCAPCFKFARWVDRNREDLEQGFIFLKIDSLLDENAKPVIKKMMGEQHYGIPFHLVFDGNENLVIDGNGPLGNIGHPSSFEGISHLKRMLKSHDGFDPEQIEMLAEDARAR